ncbi:MAG: triose-phosphate isomerase [Elusimicrobiales bacterium]
MRRAFICANWKMNLTLDSACKLADLVADEAERYSDRDVLIAPSSIYLNDIKRITANRKLFVAAQNIYFEEKGAFTGEISPLQLKSCGVDWTIIGHSERRNIFGESDDIISKKVKSAVLLGLNVILCIGEKLDEREKGKTQQVIEWQVKKALSAINVDMIEKITIAYEPVWAIGTGNNATPEQAAEAHTFIRNLISLLYNSDIAEKIRIIYGGSVTDENIDDLMSSKNIDGVLVGGASLVFERFKRIIGFVRKGEIL